jgi:hypothetical protein
MTSYDNSSIYSNVTNVIEKMSNSYDKLYPDPNQYIHIKNEIKAVVLNNHQNLTAMEVFDLLMKLDYDETKLILEQLPEDLRLQIKEIDQVEAAKVREVIEEVQELRKTTKELINQVEHQTEQMQEMINDINLNNNFST